MICASLTTLVCANFVAEGIRESLHYWAVKLNREIDVDIVPSYEFVQQLIDPLGGVARCQGVCVVLINLRRWVYVDDHLDKDSASNRVDDLIVALESATEYSQASMFIVVSCPWTPCILDHDLVAAEGELAAALHGRPHIDFISIAELNDLYPLDRYTDYFDDYLNSTADIPYSRLGFANLGTMISRAIYARFQLPKKVIIVDCDNTLWSGQCAEDGPLGIGLEEGYLYLQRFLVNQVFNGRVLCVSSKNNEADVLDVLDNNPDMCLRRSHLSAWAINWRDKPTNVVELSQRLCLALDSFIFIDDDPYECELMQKLLPQVLTLCLRSDPTLYYDRLRSVWELDLRGTASRNAERTTSYIHDGQRVAARSRMASLKQFIRTLDMRINFGPLSRETLLRASEITYRTNQFNLNGVRYAPFVVHRLWKLFTCEIIVARDRFGDYGIIGFMASHLSSDAIHIDALFVSCRVLGRGVERLIQQELHRRALEVGVPIIRLMFSSTPKNEPARAFVETMGAVINNGMYEVAVES